MTEPNVDLLRRTMDEILAHPELHFQKCWAIRMDCGTAYCFAGWACVLSGLAAEQAYLTDVGDETSFLEEDGGFIDTKARDLLGIDDRTAERLFSSENDTATLKHYVDEIAEHGMIRDAQNDSVWE